MADMFDFLKTFLDPEKSVSMPEGMQFTNTGFIGALMAQCAWMFWAADDITIYDLPYKSDVDYIERGREGSHFYYFFNQEAGKAAADKLERFAPRHVWRLEMDTNTVINFGSPDAAEKWGKSIGADARITALGSNKYRHEYHMLALPAFVDAIARVVGLIKEPVWHCEELLNIEDGALTDEFQWRMIGHPDANNADAEAMAELLKLLDDDVTKAHAVVLDKKDAPKGFEKFVGVKIHYTASVLWKRRAALWKALGENNPNVYLSIGESDTNRGKESETTSEELSKALVIATHKWNAPIWARLYVVPDPSVASAYQSSGNTRRPLMPIVGEIFANEEAARAAVGDTGTGEPVATKEANLPPYPSAWVGAEADWKQMLADEKKTLGGKLPENPPGKVKLANKFQVEFADIEAWWGLV